MSDSLQEVKEKLMSLGLSTATPGLKGEQRREELLNRLEEAKIKEKKQKKYDEKQVKYEEKQERYEREDMKEEKENMSHYQIPSFSDLSLSEIRSRLEILGEVFFISISLLYSFIRTLLLQDYLEKREEMNC
jgi:hypothetical protein